MTYGHASFAPLRMTGLGDRSPFASMISRLSSEADAATRTVLRIARKKAHGRRAGVTPV